MGVFRSLAVALVAALAAGAVTSAEAADPTVFAAASLKNALDDVVAVYSVETGRSVTVSYAGSSALAKQIEAGAPADIFISADLSWMDYLAEKNLVRVDTRLNLLGNTLVLVAPADSTATLELSPGMSFDTVLGADGRLAMASVDAVPAGKYGKASLEALGAWDGVEGRVVQAENVRAALAFVATGEAALGIVYATDAAIEPKVRVVATFPEDTHPRIVYPAAVLAQAAAEDTAAFFSYLSGPRAAAIFQKYGFSIPAGGV